MKFILSRSFVVVVLGLEALALPSGAWAWGRQAHQAIAYGAERLLTPQTVAGIEALKGAEGWPTLKPGNSRYFRKADQELTEFCAGQGTELALVADWADAWKERHRNTGAWHFVDLPGNRVANAHDLPDACPGGNCIPVQLTRFVGVLRNRQATRLARLEALLWVVHLVGDIHQPLHCADRGDRGGNADRVEVMGRHRENLHGMWDTEFFYMAHVRPRELAGELDLSQPAGPFDPDAWALQSNAVAVRFAYPQYDRCGGRYGRAELAEAWPVVTKQLSRAAVRLADVLNNSF